MSPSVKTRLLVAIGGVHRLVIASGAMVTPHALTTEMFGRRNRMAMVIDEGRFAAREGFAEERVLFAGVVVDLV